MNTRTATCSCGQLTATVTGDPIRISVCHCLACQRRTGSAFGVQARFRSESVQVAGESKQYTRIGDEGSKATFSFCPICGAIVHWQNEGYEGSIAIPVGAFAEPGFPPPTFSVYEERKHSWVVMPEGMEHMA
jgi:hypothetical protein